MQENKSGCFFLDTVDKSGTELLDVNKPLTVRDDLMINQGLELLQFTPLNVKLCSKVVA